MSNFVEFHYNCELIHNNINFLVHAIYLLISKVIAYLVNLLIVTNDKFFKPLFYESLEVLNKIKKNLNVSKNILTYFKSIQKKFL